MRSLSGAANLGARHAWLWRHREAFGQSAGGGKPRLLVDVSGIRQRDAHTGIQRVVRAVWSELQSRSGFDFEVLPVFATAKQGYCYAPFDFLDNKRSVERSTPVGVRQGDKFLGLDLSAQYLPKYRRQLQLWRAHGASVHIVVYDLLPLLHPEWFEKNTPRQFRRWFDVVAGEADQAICISDQVVRDVNARKSELRPPSRVAVGRMNMGGDIAASVPSRGRSPAVARLIARLGTRPAILMVGTVEPRKAYDVAVAAFHHLWESAANDAPDLVIVGKKGWKTTALQDFISAHPESGNRLHWLTQVTDEGLCELYDACTGVLVASRGEGFGLPLVEACTHGRPVLARDLPVFREQGLPNVHFFSDDSPRALAARLASLVSASGRSPVASPKLPTWSDAVDGLLREIGLVATVPDRATHVRWSAG